MVPRFESWQYSKQQASLNNVAMPSFEIKLAVFMDEYRQDEQVKVMDLIFCLQCIVHDSDPLEGILCNLNMNRSSLMGNSTH